MVKAILGVGSNVERHKWISQGLSMLADNYGEINISPTFESKAIGFDGSNFFNLVVSFNTDQTLSELINICRWVEDNCGRDRSGPKFGPRTLDIDLLSYGDLVCDSPIELPRGEILTNAFVLWPLAILEPDTRHPVTGDTYSVLWQQYDNKQSLWQVSAPWDPS